MFITISARDYSSKGGTENSAFDASKKPEGMEAVRLGRLRLGRLRMGRLVWPRKKIYFYFDHHGARDRPCSSPHNMLAHAPV